MKRESKLAKEISSRPLSQSDPYFIHKSILRSLLTDVNRLRPGTKGLDRDLVTLEARLEHEGVSLLTVTLGTLGKAFDKGLSEGTFTCPTGFKRARGSMIPLIFSGVMGDVFDPSTGDLVKGRDCREDVFILRQLLYFLEEVRTIVQTS
jgi:hypothetical protein